VTFRDLPRRLLEAYLASGEWRDRAGAYAVQGLGSALVGRVHGDLSNVIGLPVALLLELGPELLGPAGRSPMGKPF
jgi:septum formation protein